MKYFCRSLALAFLLLWVAAASAQWQLLDSFPAHSIGDGFDATSPLHAAVPGWNAQYEKAVFTTYDGGDSWQERLLTHISVGMIVDISLAGSDSIWICTGYPAQILFSPDSGNTWSTQFSDTTATDFLNYIEMFDPLHGVAMGDALSGTSNPAFLRTSDGGLHWNLVFPENIGGWSGDVWRRVDFVDSDHGFFFAGGISPNQLFKTLDGGLSWSATSHPTNALDVIRFYDDQIGLSVTWRTYHFTRDGGITWTEYPKAESWGMAVAYCPQDPAKVWIGTDNDLFYSGDSGQTWSFQTQIGNIRDITMIDSLNGWATGTTMYRTTTGGGSMTAIGSFNGPSMSTLPVAFPNPFNGRTTIDYTLMSPGNTTLSIYNLRGELIKMLHQGPLDIGQHRTSWDGRDSQARSMPSGLYLCSLSTENETTSTKLMLIK